MGIKNPADRKISGRHRKILVGRLIDGTGVPAGENILMTIEKGRIIELRPFRRDEAPPGDLWRDLSGCTVMPPLIDCHVHMTLSGHLVPDRQTARPNPDCQYHELTISRHIQDCLQHGVLGVRDGGDPSGSTLHYKLTALTPNENAFRLNTAGTAWHREGRYGGLLGRAVPAGEDPVPLIEGGTGAGVDHIKLIQSGLNSLKEFGKQTRPQFDADTIRRIFAFSRSLGIGLMVHANGEAPVAAAIAGGCDSIEHGYFMGEENLRKMADARITWVPTAVPMKAYAGHLPKDSLENDVARRTLDHQLEQLSRARKYGVPVALGTDSGSPGVMHGKTVWEELQLLVSAGYPLEEAVRCATLNGACLMENRSNGCLGVGKPASFVAVKGLDSKILSSPSIVKVILSGRMR